MVVGYFEQAYPKTAGRYRYMPYRGPGHYMLGRALATGPARCTFESGGGPVHCTVRSLPESHVIEIEAVSHSTDVRQ
jgi:hypothetical protein